MANVSEDTASSTTMPGTQLLRKVTQDPIVLFTLRGPIRTLSDDESPAPVSIRLSSLLTDLNSLNKLQYRENWLSESIVPLLIDSLAEIPSLGLHENAAKALLYKHFSHRNECRHNIKFYDVEHNFIMTTQFLLDNTFPEALRNQHEHIQINVRIRGACRDELIAMARARDIPLSISTKGLESLEAFSPPEVTTVDPDDTTSVVSNTSTLLPPTLASSDMKSDPTTSVNPSTTTQPTSVEPAQYTFVSLSPVIEAARSLTPASLTSSTVTARTKSSKLLSQSSNISILRRPVSAPPEYRATQDTNISTPTVNPHVGGIVTTLPNGRKIMTSQPADPPSSVSFDPVDEAAKRNASWRSSDLTTSPTRSAMTAQRQPPVLHSSVNGTHSSTADVLPSSVNFALTDAESQTVISRWSNRARQVRAPTATSNLWQQYGNRDQLPRRSAPIDIIQQRHEETAAFNAASMPNSFSDISQEPLHSLGDPGNSSLGSNDNRSNHRYEPTAVPPGRITNGFGGQGPSDPPPPPGGWDGPFAGLRYEPDWTKIHLSANQPYHVNPTTDTVYPWYTFHPVYHFIVCHPVAMNIQALDQELFLSRFTIPFHAEKSVKNIYYNTTRLSLEEDIFPFYVKFAATLNFHGVYVPPIHTQTAHDTLGTWFPLLPAHTQHLAAVHHSEFIHKLLLYEKSGLSRFPHLKAIVSQTSDGYQALQDLLAYGCHPLLTTNRQDHVMPRQVNTMSLHTYILHWQRHIFVLFLESTVLSDRYFLEQFVIHMHSSLRMHFQPFLERMSSEIRLSKRLPTAYGPYKLYMTLMTRARSVNLSTDTLTRPPNELSRPTSSSAIRQIAETSFSATDDADFFCIVAAIQHEAGPNCALCNKSGHLIFECPQLRDISSDPHRTRLVLGNLLPSSRQNANSNSPSNRRSPRQQPQRPTRPQQRTNVRQVLIDAGIETPDDALLDSLLNSAADLTNESDARHVNFEDITSPTTNSAPDDTPTGPDFR